jgi:hypothetical protein
MSQFQTLIYDDIKECEKNVKCPFQRFGCNKALDWIKTSPILLVHEDSIGL